MSILLTDDTELFGQELQRLQQTLTEFALTEASLFIHMMSS